MTPTMAPEALARHAADAELLLKQLANRNRLMILCALVDGERSVGDLNALVPLSQSALSQHLGRLRGAGMVATRRRGQAVYYRLAGEAVRRVLATLHDIYCAA